MFRQATTYGKYMLSARPFDQVADEDVTRQLRKVFDTERQFYAFVALKLVRKKNQTDKRVLQVEDMGAGSKKSRSNERSVKSITDSAVKPRKYAELMFRLVESFQSEVVVELGTSLGLTTGYLSKANKQGKVFTMEGAAEIAKVARENFRLMKLNNVTLIEGNFDNTLPDLLSKLNKVDLAFLDGNHRKEPTLKYFNWLLPKLHPNSIVVVDDINWSADMREAWEELKNHSSVTLSIDLFEMGVLFLNPDLKKEDLSVRY